MFKDLPKITHRVTKTISIQFIFLLFRVRRISGITFWMVSTIHRSILSEIANAMGINHL